MKKRYRDELGESKTFSNVDNMKKMRTEQATPFSPIQIQKLSLDSSINKVNTTTSDKIISAANNLKSSTNASKSRPVERKPNSLFIEKRIASMSHIKLVNTRHKNFIIPVLPGVINKIINK